MYHDNRVELGNTPWAESLFPSVHIGSAAVYAVENLPAHLFTVTEKHLADTVLLACASLPDHEWHDALCRQLDEGLAYE